MKKLLIFIFIISTFQVFSQYNCDIVLVDTTLPASNYTVCAGTKVQMLVGLEDTLNYLWTPGDVAGPLFEPIVEDTTTYYLLVYNDDSTWTCQDSLTFNVYPKVVVEFTQENGKHCFNECKTIVKAAASEGLPPYIYQWPDTISVVEDSIALGLCSEEEYKIIVYDTVCEYEAFYEVKALSMPEIEIYSEPEGNVFDINPTVSFWFVNNSADSIPLINWIWDFNDETTSNEANPTHVFSPSDSAIFVEFIYTTDDQCTDTDSIEITIEVFVYEAKQYIFTPNGDGINEVFSIDTLKNYISNEIVIFNRWGVQVFEQNNFDKWDGGNSPDGVYFYIVRAFGYFREDVFRGTVTIMGSPH